jgi:hypothetical protein
MLETRGKGRTKEGEPPKHWEIKCQCVKLPFGYKQKEQKHWKGDARVTLEQ